MTHSEMVDCGMDFDYSETIALGDEYLWEEEPEYDWDGEPADLEMGFNPYEGCYDFDC